MKSAFFIFAIMAPLSIFAQNKNTLYFKLEGKEIEYFHKEGNKTIIDSVVKKDFTILLPQEKDVKVIVKTNGDEKRFTCKEFSKGSWSDMDTYDYQLNDNLSFEFMIVPEGVLLEGKQDGKQLLYRIQKLDRRYKMN